MRHLNRGTTTVAATLLVAGAAAIPAAAAHDVDLYARLHGTDAFPRAMGVSEYERGDGRELDVRVNNIAKLADRYVYVYVHADKIGRIHVSATGTAHREWDTAHGDNVPFVSKGAHIKVKTHSGKVIVKGTYRLDRDT